MCEPQDGFLPCHESAGRNYAGRRGLETRLSESELVETITHPELSLIRPKRSITESLKRGIVLVVMLFKFRI